MAGVLPDGTYLSVVMDAAVRGRRREAILAADRDGRGLADVDEAVDDRTCRWPGWSG